MGLNARRAIGMLRRGDDLILVEATMRAGRATWRAETIADFFAGEQAPALPEWIAPAAGRASRTLLWPTDDMLRREIDIAGQPVSSFRDAVGDNLGSFFPALGEAGVLWDVAPITTAAGSAGAWIGAVPADRAASTLERLGQAGLAPTRIAPTGLAMPMLLRDVEIGEQPSSVLEVSPTGWALHLIDGLRWNGCRAGRGPASAAAIEEARRRGAAVCAWSEGAAPDIPGAVVVDTEKLALGGAILGAWPRLGSDEGRAPEFNLVRRRERSRLLEHPAVRWSGAAAAVVIGVMILADAYAARADAESAAVAARFSVLEPESGRVDQLRGVNERLTSAHDRLWGLEEAYAPRWAIMAALSEALPTPAWVERLEISDEVVLAIVLAPSAAEVIEALEASSAFEQVKQVAPAATIDTGESRLQIEARLTFTSGAAVAAPEAEATP